MHAWHLACYRLLQGQGMTQLPTTTLGFPPHTAPLVSYIFCTKKKLRVKQTLLNQRFDFMSVYVTSIVAN